MSKLGDAIRRSLRTEAQPMGFGAARPAATPSMLTGFLGGQAELEAARKAGADLVVVDARRASLAAGDAKKARDAADNLALGAWTQVADAATAKALRQAGVDFLVIEPETTPAAALLDDDLGYVLALPEAPEELFLRSLEPLHLEALYLPPGRWSGPLTVAGQVELSRIGALSRRPLICEAAPETSKEELQCLRAAGVAVLLVSSATGISRLKETVGSLPPRRQRREERPVLSLPRGQAPPEVEEEDDDDRNAL